MVKVIPFNKSLSRARGCFLDSFINDGELLEFAPSDHVPSQAPTRPAAERSIYASDWTNQELADLHRAHSLIQSAQPGLDCARGISDEGDPWFLIDDDRGDVLVHICRIKDVYILDSVGLPKILKGTDFNALIKDFLTSAAKARGRDRADTEDSGAADRPANVVQLARGGTVCLHPSMMIAALVWTLLMDTKELTLPSTSGPAHDSGHDSGSDGSDHGMGGYQHNAPSGNHDLSEISAAAAVRANLANAGKFDTASGDGAGDVHTGTSGTMIAQLVQKDEKQPHFSVYSHALTMIGIAAGFYVSAEASDVFWKSIQQTHGDTLEALGETEAHETNDLVTHLDHLPDALDLLSNVVDLVVLENHDDYAAKSHNAADEGAESLSIPAAIDPGAGQQMVPVTGKVVHDGPDGASQGQTADASDKAVERAGTMHTGIHDDMYGSMYGSGLDIGKNVQESGSSTSIQGVVQVYASNAADVIHYDTSSFTAGLGRFNGELQKYSAVLESITLPVNDDGMAAAGQGGQEPSPEAGVASEIALGTDGNYSGSSPAHYNPFDDAARSFLDAKLANSDLEILVFDHEVIFIDKAVYSGDATAVSWQLDDGGVVSMVGLSSDMADFFVA